MCIRDRNNIANNTTKAAKPTQLPTLWKAAPYTDDRLDVYKRQVYKTTSVFR